MVKYCDLFFRMIVTHHCSSQTFTFTLSLSNFHFPTFTFQLSLSHFHTVTHHCISQVSDHKYTCDFSKKHVSSFYLWFSCELLSVLAKLSCSVNYKMFVRLSWQQPLWILLQVVNFFRRKQFVSLLLCFSKCGQKWKKVDEIFYQLIFSWMASMNFVIRQLFPPANICLFQQMWAKMWCIFIQES